MKSPTFTMQVASAAAKIYAENHTSGTAISDGAAHTVATITFTPSSAEDVLVDFFLSLSVNNTATQGSVHFTLDGADVPTSNNKIVRFGTASPDEYVLSGTFLLKSVSQASHTVLMTVQQGLALNTITVNYAQLVAVY